MKLTIASLAFTALLALPPPGQARAANMTAEKIKSAFCPFAPKPAKAILADSIFHEASLEDFAGLFLQQAEYYGPCRGVTQTKDGFLLEYRDAKLPLRGEFEGGKIKSFYFGAPDFPRDSFEKIAAFAKKNIGNVSILASREGKKLFELNPKPLNIGANHSLFILKALREKGVDPKELVTLDENTKSGSPGFLHNWATGTLLTVDTLKNLMIVERDLTAADLLIAKLGRESLESQGKSLHPFFTNREFALLQEERDANKIAGDAKARAALFKQNIYIEFPKERYDTVEKIGWFATNEELCGALFSLKNENLLFTEFRAFTAQEGRERWEKYTLIPARGYGIAQDSALLKKKGEDGWYCVSVTANAKGAVEEQAVSDLMARIYAIIHGSTH